MSDNVYYVKSYGNSQFFSFRYVIYICDWNHKFAVSAGLCFQFELSAILRFHIGVKGKMIKKDYVKTGFPAMGKVTVVLLSLFQCQSSLTDVKQRRNDNLCEYK